MVNPLAGFCVSTRYRRKGGRCCLCAQVGMHTNQLFAYPARDLALHHRFNGAKTLLQPNDLSLHIAERISLANLNGKPVS